ncbi:MAG TPA: Hsp70 family protein [Verrucomicrobiae bacterium]
MINFGIDLGTTNSLIAKSNKGVVEVFKNPNGFKETLPSVVGFRNDRILVGEQAKAYMEKEPQNVKGRFKRRMGTTESFKIKSLDQFKTPIELSAFVLKELKTFIHTGETPEAVVITIPASFDMVQSNATKEAGYAAGFNQVVLLQEPIAASLAYANKEKDVDLKNSQWIVYDLGGGTFDVALVKIVEGELKVVDHEGDNYLGGLDFDEWIVERIVVPYLEKKGKFAGLLAQMKSEAGKYNRLWHHLVRLAEDAKIELSTKTSAEIEITAADDEGKIIDAIIPITRSEYESIIKEAIDQTAEMLKKILTRNSLRPQDLKFVLMVGGATYTPFVRKRIEERLGIPINTGIDPTNAIAVGAASFAATREIKLIDKAAEKSAAPGALRIKSFYNRVSQEREEIFSAKVEGDTAGLFYRITREDGGYDSGLKQLSGRIVEDLPLRESAYNHFAFKILNGQNNPVPADLNSIQITQGKYSVAGQMLPEDLSLVKDKDGDTALELIFAKNSILPAKVKKMVEASKPVMQNTNDQIRIIVVQGHADNHSTANKTVGYLEIAGKLLKRDLFRGTEIDLTFELSESCDLTVHAYVNPSGPEFSQIFKPTFRDVPIKALNEEVQLLDSQLEKEKNEAMEHENYEMVGKLEKLVGPIQELQGEAMLLTLDDVTDSRYKLDDRKRKIAQELNQLTSGKRIERLRSEYNKVKKEVAAIVDESGNDHERSQLKEIIVQEHTLLNSTNPQRLQAVITQLYQISFSTLRRRPAFVVDWFNHLLSKRETLNDPSQAKNLIEAGKKYLAAEDYDQLCEVNIRLHRLLPQKEKDSAATRYFTGIS